MSHPMATWAGFDDEGGAAIATRRRGELMLGLSLGTREMKGPVRKLARDGDGRDRNQASGKEAP